MFLRTSMLCSFILLSACSSNTVKHVETKRIDTPAIKYAKNNSKLVPIQPIASSSNACIDHFNFLHQTASNDYKKYSSAYIKISDGYIFLKTNQNILSIDAKRSYKNTLDMKLNTLCSDVNYAGFQVVQQKIDDLNSI